MNQTRLLAGARSCEQFRSVQAARNRTVAHAGIAYEEMNRSVVAVRLASRCASAGTALRAPKSLAVPPELGYALA